MRRFKLTENWIAVANMHDPENDNEERFIYAQTNEDLEGMHYACFSIVDEEGNPHPGWERQGCPISIDELGEEVLIPQLH